MPGCHAHLAQSVVFGQTEGGCGRLSRHPPIYPRSKRGWYTVYSSLSMLLSPAFGEKPRARRASNLSNPSLMRRMTPTRASGTPATRKRCFIRGRLHFAQGSNRMPSVTALVMPPKGVGSQHLCHCSTIAMSPTSVHVLLSTRLASTKCAVQFCHGQSLRRA